MKVLLVIDLQKEFYAPQKYEQILEYIENSDFDYIIGTVLQNEKSSNFVKKLNWGECFDISEDSIEYKYDKLIIKNSYGIPIDKIKEYKNDEITVIGCDADSCVLATCFYLFDNNFDFKIDLGHIYTTGGINLYAETENIIKRNFGKCLLKNSVSNVVV